ncbi:MAG: hypothetical protein DRH56_03855 [Deltaproteobacteria bacterium]|nr:MAG: hypothetical protein DRH56_03855 [Deltaproteobacteria bacterium]
MEKRIRTVRNVGLLAVLSLVFLANTAFTAPPGNAYEKAKQDAMGVCPPFYLLDESGRIINPVKGTNADVPYSPEKTCGRCHDYKKITQGYHFQQGAGEKMSPGYAETYPWCTGPGQYGGRW